MHHGRRRRGVHAAARRGDDLDRPVAAGIGGDGRVGRRHQRVEHGRAGGGEAWRCSGPCDCGLQPDRSTVISSPATITLAWMRIGCVGDAVVVDVVLELVGAVGDAADHRAHAGLGRVEHLLQRALEALLARAWPQAARCSAAPICSEASCDCRSPHSNSGWRTFCRMMARSGFVELAGVEQLHRRDAQAFLEDLGRARAVAAGRGAADVEVVAQRADEADAPAVVEHRPVGDDVGQVLAAAVGVVGDDDVVGPPLLRRGCSRRGSR